MQTKRFSGSFFQPRAQTVKRASQGSVGRKSWLLQQERDCDLKIVDVDVDDVFLPEAGHQ